MAEAVVSPLLQVAFETLTSNLLGHLKTISRIDDELDHLSSTLSTILAVLQDAEQRQIQDKSLKDWLRNLKHAAYDADDLIDEMAYEALRAKAQKNERNQVRSRISLSCFEPNQFRLRHEIASGIKRIRQRLDRISNDRLCFHLKERDGREQQENIGWRHTSSLVDESGVFGRDEDRERMVELLVSDENPSGKHVSVISIVGMGGVGKTTLAQIVYNDREVENHFDLRAWVCVSEDFDLKRVSREIIESATGEALSFSGVDPIQRRLQEIFCAKKFLLVLDDMWNENRGDWDKLRVPLRVGAKGSKIIVTTRSDVVTSAVDADHRYHLNVLSDDDCLTAFTWEAFADGTSNAYPNLMGIGKELMAKCQGLPLVAKVLGGLLSSSRDESNWRSILKSEIWHLPEKDYGVLPALRLSYHHLPPHLKQCFTYCSIFPKDYEFEKEKLVQLWIAEGYIRLEEGKRLEDTGTECFNDLLLRSFFHSNKTWGECITYKMHDLMHDLAQSMSYGECFRVDHGKTQHVPDKVRHLVIFGGPDIEPGSLESFYKFKTLRTFMLVNGFIECFNKQLLHNLFNLRQLRVLDLSRAKITELPDMIGNLKHLRYLDLSYTMIKGLPKSVSRCYNLQTLDLSHCYGLLQLPKETRRLLNLRHLSLKLCEKLQCMPLDIGKLCCLETLTRFVVGRERGCKIAELKGLPELRGTISISKLENVSNVEEAEVANLKNKSHLEALRLTWSEEYAQINLQDKVLAMERILEGLQPHNNLKALSLCNYGGVCFPTWMQDRLLCNLVSIRLYHCKKCKFLPPLGQLPFLQYLFVHGVDGVESIGREFCGDGGMKGFPALKILKLCEMVNLVKWHGVVEGEFPCLQQVTLVDCCKLTVLPILPSTLEKLKLKNCWQLTSLPQIPSLLKLTLSGCNEVLLTSARHFTSLSTLKIRDFPDMVSLPGNLFHALTRLKCLTISCERLVSLIEDNGIDNGLPTTVTHLWAYDCSSLETLPKGFGNLTSLHMLKIENCPQLHSLPEGLPSTLQHWTITGCPMLKENRCREEAKNWPKKGNMPCKYIDFVNVS